MPFRKGPPVPKYEYGPECLETPDRPECPFRSVCTGYAPTSSPQIKYFERDGTVVEHYDRITTPYLFLFEALGRDEVEGGRNAIGPTGGIFNKLLKNNTVLRRSEQTVANTVRCRPIEWVGTEDGGQEPATYDSSGDNINAKPSPAQIRECAARYTDDLIGRFDGKYIIACGAIPARYMTGRNLSVMKYRGTVFEHGELISCANCGGEGTVPRSPKKCKSCGGRGLRKCEECGRWKHLKRCESKSLPPCGLCESSGLVPRDPKKCGECNGAGRLPKDPDNPYVSPKLKPGQFLFITLHPAYLTRNPTYWEVSERDFRRMATIEADMSANAGTDTLIYPRDDPRVEPLLAADFASVDIETSGSIDPAEGNIECIAATERIGAGTIFHPEDPRVAQILASSEIVGQNFGLYDLWWLDHKGYNIPRDTRIVDTRYLGKLLNPDTPNDLTYLAGEFANPPIRGYWKTKQNYRDNLARVGGIDVDATLRVKNGQWEVLENRGQLHIAEDYIIPMTRLIHEMRKRGMKIDRAKMGEARKRILASLAEERTLLPPWGGVGTENQHEKVRNHLYNTLSLPIQKKRGTRKITADRGALEELRSRLDTGHRTVSHLDEGMTGEALTFVNRVMACRDMSKLESSFLRYKLSGTDFVHPALNMGGSARGKHEAGRGAATFRFSCTDPNAQQVPKCTCKKDPRFKNDFPKGCMGRNPHCRGARHVFIPDYPDWEIASFDLKQAEVVGFLWWAEAWDVLRKVLLEGMDAHQALADKILGREASEGERDEFKNTTFALLFGEAPRTTAARIHILLKEVMSAREMYFKMLPGVEDYRKEMVRLCRARGYVESPFGFRRYIRVNSEKGRAANMTCNHPIQNIPPIVIGKAMLRIDRELPSPARLWMQVHDEVVLCYPKEMREVVIDCVHSNIRMPVPEMPAPVLGMAAGLVFNSDVEVGPNWGSLVDINVVRDMERVGENPWA